LSLWDRFSGKQEPEGDVTMTVPLVQDLSSVQYPTENYSNFAKEGYGKNEVVNACIKELGVAAASPRYFVQRVRSSGMDEEDASTSPLGALFANPNPQADMYSWVEQLVTFLYVAGNVYVLKERNKTNKVIHLWLLRPDRVSIKPQDMGVNAYMYTIDGREYEIPAENISHLSFPNPAGDIYGQSPLSVLAKTINLDLAMTDFAKMFFQNAGVPSGLLKIKRRINSQEEAGVIRSRWRSTFGGSNNMHRVAVLDDDAEYQPMASAPKDMDLTGLHNMTESRICSVLGVPPILIGANVGLQRATYSNYKEARLSFHSETVEPLIQRILRFLNNSMAPEFGAEFKLAVDFSAVLSPLDDNSEQAERISLLYQSGIITLNEARQYVGQETVDDGDTSIVGGVDFGADMKPDLGNRAIATSKVLKAPDPSPRATRMNDRLLDLRLREVDRLDVDLERHFRSLRDRVNGILGRLMERSAQIDITKDLPLNADEFIPPGATNELADLLRNSGVRITRDVFREVNDAGLIGAVEWSEQSPVVTGMLTSVQGRASMIHSTTKKWLQRSIVTAFERGYSIEQLARGVPKENFPGVQGIMNDTKTRSRLIARTETMRSQNMTTTKLYQQQGFNYVQASDIDGGVDNYVDPADGLTCSQRNGQVFRTSEAYDVMDHPNGTLTWIPMPMSYKE